MSPPLSSSPSSCSLPGTNPAGSFRGPSRLDGWICDDCESVALQSRVLKQHKESQHEGLRYSCAACDHFVPRARVLKQHNGSKSVGLSGLHSLRARSRPAWLLFAVVPFVMNRQDSIMSQLCIRPRVRPMRGGREDGRPQAHIAGSRLRPLQNVFS